MLSGYFLLLLKGFIEKHKLGYFYAYTGCGTLWQKIHTFS